MRFPFSRLLIAIALAGLPAYADPKPKVRQAAVASLSLAGAFRSLRGEPN